MFIRDKNSFPLDSLDTKVVKGDKIGTVTRNEDKKE